MMMKSFILGETIPFFSIVLHVNIIIIRNIKRDTARGR